MSFPDIRSDFPILSRRVHGQDLVYLDSAATTQKPLAVLDAMDRFYRESNANVHRGAHRLSEESTDVYEGARRKVARFVGASVAAEIIFTRGTTEAINLVAQSWGRGRKPGDSTPELGSGSRSGSESTANSKANIGPGDRIVVTEMEHHANLVPWQLLAEQCGAEIKAIPISDEGRLDLTELDSIVSQNTKMVAISHVSNVLGVENPVREVARAAHAVGALCLLDAAQSVPHRPMDLAALEVDFAAFSAHKMLGPSGIGCLWARRELLEIMPPWQGGGEMIGQVEIERSTWAKVPHKFEAGTPAIAEAAGLSAAIDYLEKLGMSAIHRQIKDLTAYAIDALTEVPGFRLIGPEEDRAGPISFTLQGIHPHDLATILDRQGIAIRAGHHCAMPLHRRLRIPASARASVYVYNTEAEIDRLVEGLCNAREVFGL